MYSFLFYIIISSNLSSELVADIPAKYLQNLEDVLASNRTPILIEGRGKIKNSQGNLDVKHLLLKRAEERKADFEGMKSRSAYPILTMGITKQRMVGLFETKMKANGLRQVICKINKKSKTYPKIKMSDPFGYVIVGFYYSLKITDQLAYRISVTYKRIIQSGLMMRLETKVDKQHLKCVFMMEMRDQRDRENVPLPFKIFAPILCLFSIGLVFAMICFVSECLTAMIITNISILSPRQQQTLSIRCLRKVCKCFVTRSSQGNERIKGRLVWKQTTTTTLVLNRLHHYRKQQL